jgi:predicted transcriptional regulator
MTTTTNAIITTSRYNPYHRKSEDIQRQLLNYLRVNGPTNITRCLQFLQINHKQFKKAFAELGPAGFIVKEEVDKIPLLRTMRGRKNYRRLGKLTRIPPRATSIISITPAGNTYLEKMNKMGRLLKWVT